MLKVILICLFSTCVLCQRIRYDNYTLFKILPQNNEHVSFLQNLYESERNLDFWNDPMPAAKFVNIMADPIHKSTLEANLNYYNIPFEIVMPNVQEVIDKENVRSARSSTNMSWDNYYNLEDIYAWMTEMARNHSANATIINVGKTYERNDIAGLKISRGKAKMSIFIESGIHAREWITMATACYIINELLTSANAKVLALAEEFDWYIFPVTNPDGYRYSRIADRMWRKNRRPFGSSFGVDLNRNWNNNWLAAGASIDPTSDIYAGPGPFSELETRLFSEYIRSIGNIHMYLSFHSFSQFLLIPYGYTTEPVDNYYDALNIGRRAMGALSVRYGTPYVTGNIAETIYAATGGSVDWVKGHVKVPLVYCYEFRDQGQYGMLLPSDQILPNSLEVWDSIQDLVYQGKRFGYFNAAGVVRGGTVIAIALLTMFMM